MNADLWHELVRPWLAATQNSRGQLGILEQHASQHYQHGAGTHVIDALGVSQDMQVASSLCRRRAGRHGLVTNIGG